MYDAYLRHRQQAISDLVRSCKMDNVTFVKDKDGIEQVIIDHGNSQFTSMAKTTYDEMQASADKL
jgi:hypothetical protein